MSRGTEPFDWDPKLKEAAVHHLIEEFGSPSSPLGEVVSYYEELLRYAMLIASDTAPVQPSDAQVMLSQEDIDDSDLPAFKFRIR